MPDTNIFNMIQKEIYLCVKEAVHNAIKHGGTNGGLVIMYVKENILVLKISDDGRGFNVVVAKRTGGHGIMNITERMSSINGSLIFYQNNGCTVELMYPLPS